MTIINNVNVIQKDGEPYAVAEGIDDIHIAPINNMEELKAFGLQLLNVKWGVPDKITPIMELGLAIGTMSNADGVPYSEIYREAWS